MVEAEEVQNLIRQGVTGVSHIEVRDLTGTKDHYEATVVATAFEELSRVRQHQLVYQALGALMAGPIHALALHTHTPASWEESQS